MNNNDNTNDINLNELSEDQLMDLFCEQMMIDKGLEDLQGQTREDARNELKEQLTLEINRSILAALPDEKFDELDRKMEAGELTSEEITKAVEESNLNLDEITEGTMLKFRELYLQGDDAENGGEEAGEDNNNNSDSGEAEANTSEE